MIQKMSLPSLRRFCLHSLSLKIVYLIITYIHAKVHFVYLYVICYILCILYILYIYIYIYVNVCILTWYLISDCVSWVNASGGAIPADAWVAWAGDGGGRGQEQVQQIHHHCHLYKNRSALLSLSPSSWSSWLSLSWSSWSCLGWGRKCLRWSSRPWGRPLSWNFAPSQVHGDGHWQRSGFSRRKLKIHYLSKMLLCIEFCAWRNYISNQGGLSHCLGW